MNNPMKNLKRWPWGTRWLQEILVVFGMVEIPPSPQPTPLELAIAEKVKTQRELLTAKSEEEQASFTVKMLEARLKRLTADVKSMNEVAE